MTQDEITPRFVEFIPRDVEFGILYVSERFKTATHLCACGCGTKVVTPLSPAEWQLHREGQTVTLNPSIGNWNDACQSHYLICRNRVVWAGKMSVRQIAAVQKRDRMDKAAHVALMNSRRLTEEVPRPVEVQNGATNWISRLATLLRRWVRGK